MAASGPAGSAPPAPSESSPEEKARPADDDIQQLIGQEEHPQLPHIKEEEEALWITQEGEGLQGPKEDELTKLPLTGVSVKTEEHKDKPPESLHWLCPSDVQQLIGQRKECLPQSQRQLSHIKDEEEDLWATQEGECLLRQEAAEFNTMPLTGISVKTEDHEDKPPEFSQLHHTPSEEIRGAEPASSSSPQRMTTEAEGDHCGGSEADRLLAPLSDSDDTVSHSAEEEDGNDTREPLSSDTDGDGDEMTHADNKHPKKKTGKMSFTCSACDKSFSSRSELTRHMPKHTGERPFACSLCGKSYSYRPSLTYHMLTHKGEKPFGCSVCSQRFLQKSHMVSHMSTHSGEKPFSCSVCDKSFSQKCYLTYHKRTHTGEKPFCCSVCAKSFSVKGRLAHHMLSHTGEKRFSCSDCAKTFSYKSDLNRHMVTHTGEKLFNCSVCAKRFLSKCDLTRHMMTHTGEKPFACSVCGKTFSYKHHLTYHMSTHTGKKPFGCSVCGQRYSRKSVMVSHMEKAHRRKIL